MGRYPSPADPGWRRAGLSLVRELSFRRLRGGVRVRNAGRARSVGLPAPARHLRIRLQSRPANGRKPPPRRVDRSRVATGPEGGRDPDRAASRSAARPSERRALWRTWPRSSRLRAVRVLSRKRPATADTATVEHRLVGGRIERPVDPVAIEAADAVARPHTHSQRRAGAPSISTDAARGGPTMCSRIAVILMVGRPPATPINVPLRGRPRPSADRLVQCRRSQRTSPPAARLADEQPVDLVEFEQRRGALGGDAAAV